MKQEQSAQTISGTWRISRDAGNIGRKERWYDDIRKGAEPAPVPGIIQQVFPDYYGVAWYWTTFRLPRAVGAAERVLLRFGAVDYLAEVWVNGKKIDGHEGGETPFALDVTQAVKPEAENLLAVRVLNPKHEPIDGITLKETPHRHKVIPFNSGAAYNHGGIVLPVEWAIVPAIRVTDIFVQPDPGGQNTQVHLTLRNDCAETAIGDLEITIAPATGGDQAATYRTKDLQVASGETSITIPCPLTEPHLWNLNDPFLYRSTARMSVSASGTMCHYELATRFGFRDFRFEDGYYRLNGKRLFMRSSHTCNHYPVGMQVPHDRELLRRDLLYAKAAGFNMIRFIAGVAYPEQLDFCDELGLMVYQESYASWCLGDSPRMAERYDRSMSEMIVRDRNHPSIVIWGMLNETGEGPVFRHAVKALAMVRALDDTRMAVLNSGRFDGQIAIGSLSNPGAREWQHLMGDEAPDAKPSAFTTTPLGFVPRAGDVHTYPRTPHTAETINFFRTVGKDFAHPLAITEYGIGSSVNAIRIARQFEQLGVPENLPDYNIYRTWAKNFQTDYTRLGLDEIAPNPEDILNASIEAHAGRRLFGINAIRANPRICGYNLTGTADQGMAGEGLWSTFRELKPGTVDKLNDAFAPLRWCLFAVPWHVYRGQTIQVDAVLANEDILKPGKYPARIQVAGPGGIVMDRKVSVTIPPSKPGRESPLAIPVLSEKLKIKGPAGRYQVIAWFERGAAPAGGRFEFDVSDQAAFPAVSGEAIVWDESGILKAWLKKRGVRCRPLTDPAPRRRELILVGDMGTSRTNIAMHLNMARRIASGSVAIFLSPLNKGHASHDLGWLPLKDKGELLEIFSDLYVRDDFAKRHPFFAGLPSGGMMDWNYYGEVLPDHVYRNEAKRMETAAVGLGVGTVRPPGYRAGALISLHTLGAGQVIVNTLRLVENLDKHPAADRILLNMMAHVRGQLRRPAVKIPAGFDRRYYAEIYRTHAYTPYKRRWAVSDTLPGGQPIGKYTLPDEIRLAWRERTERTSWDADFIDIHADAGGLVFARGEIDFPSSVAMELLLGTDGPCKVWLGHKEIAMVAEATNPATKDKYVFPFTPDTGRQRITVAFERRGGKGWGFNLRIRRKDLRPTPEEQRARRELLPVMDPE